MSVDDKAVLINSEVFLTHDSNLHLAELLPHGSPTGIQVSIYIFNIHNNELRKPISA